MEASWPLVLAAFIFMHAGLTTLSSPFEELSFPTLHSGCAPSYTALLPQAPGVCERRLAGPTALSPDAGALAGLLCSVPPGPGTEETPGG